jgi:hypothetical protein
MSIVEDFFLVRPCALLLQPHSAAAATSALPLLPLTLTPLRCHCRRRAVLPLPPPLHFADRLLRFEARATPPGAAVAAGEVAVAAQRWRRQQRRAVAVLREIVFMLFGVLL